MSGIFYVDDFSDLLWQPPVHALAMSRSASEWELLEEFFAHASASARENSSPFVVQSPTSRKPLNSDDGVVEIENPEIPAPTPLPLAPLSRDRPPQPSHRAILSQVDAEDYRAFLKSQLDRTCAAAAKSRESSVKPEGVSSLAEDQIVASKKFQSGSHVSGNGDCILKAQSEADGGSLCFPALPPTQKKQDVPARQTTSGSSREDSDDGDLDGDTETNDHMDPADEKRVRRMQSNRESARRSRRRKQAQLNELEAEVGQLRDECTSLLTRLTDINNKCDEASVENRILNANIETLRTKVKMAEDQVKRATGLNPMAFARSNISSVGMQLAAGQTDASASVDVQMPPNHLHFYHRSVPNIPSSAPSLQGRNNSYPNNNLNSHATNPQGDNGTSNIGGVPFIRPLTVSGRHMLETPPLQHVQKQTGPTVSRAKLGPESTKGLLSQLQRIIRNDSDTYPIHGG